MQNIVNQSPKKKNYDFIDAIRCIAMMCIVSEHCIYFEPDQIHLTGLNDVYYNASLQLTKFGTICFFLLAGFLIGDNFTNYTPYQYLKRRFNSTIWPWLFWSLLFIFVVNTDVISNKIFSHSDPPGTTAGQYMWAFTLKTYLHTMYWFIPNFLFCITLLLIFKRYLYNYFFGAVLLAFTLFYSVNIYFEWIPSNHTTAILGFVFFLWLGAQLHKNWERFELWLRRQHLPLFIGLVTITFCCGLSETYVLKNIPYADPYNSLRFSNVLYSLSCFFLLLKIRHFNFVKMLKPRETTYGVYLIHYIILIRILNATVYNLRIDINHLHPLLLFAYQAGRFAYVYLIVIALVMFINKTKLRVLIGR